MEINGWSYHFEKLPYWEIRERFPYVYDHFTQSTSGEHAILILPTTGMCV